MPAAQAHRRQVLALTLGFLAGIPLVAWGTVYEHGSLLFLGILGLLTLYLCFARLTWGMYLLAIAMLLSPELTLGAPPPEAAGGMEASRPIALRIDDFIIAVMALGWFFKSAYRGEQYAISWTPINASAWFYLGATALATGLGVIGGDVTLRAGFFYNLKFFEYFLLFLLVLGIIKDRDQARRLLWIMIGVAIVVGLYGWRQVPTGERVYAPFDSEPNTLSGYFILVCSVAAGIALCSTSRVVKWFCYGSVAIALVPFLYTRSRAGYLGLLVTYFAFIAYGRQRWRLIFVGMVVLAMMGIGWISLPTSVIERIKYTFSGETQKGVEQVQIVGIPLDPSTSARILSYKHALKVWLEHPFLGVGVTGTTFIDGQFFRLLAETGALGFGTFVYMLWRIYQALTVVYRKTAEESLFKGLSLGMLCAFFGLVAHACAANTFIIIRIAEPFWMLLGVALLAPRFDGWYPEFLAYYQRGDLAGAHQVRPASPTPVHVGPQIVRPIPPRRAPSAPHRAAGTSTASGGDAPPAPPR